jgi:ribulose-phosphate 3-epimerase
MPIEIIPAIIPEDIFDLKDKLSKVVGQVSTVQVDVTDGKFVPSVSWPYKKREDLYFAHILSEDEGMPFWNELDFEIDLMVQKPAEKVEEWISAGAERLLVHIESDDAKSVIQGVRERFPRNGSLGIEIGAAISFDTPLEVLREVAEEIDVVQHMGIARIGFQGESFDQRVVERVSQLRAVYPNHVLSVDGGVNLDNAPALISAGVNRLVIGSAIFRSENIHDTIRQFQSL